MSELCKCCQMDPIYSGSKRGNCRDCYRRCTYDEKNGIVNRTCRREDLVTDEYFEEYREQVLQQVSAAPTSAVVEEGH